MRLAAIRRANIQEFAGAVHIPTVVVEQIQQCELEVAQTQDASMFNCFIRKSCLLTRPLRRMGDSVADSSFRLRLLGVEAHQVLSRARVEHDGIMRVHQSRGWGAVSLLHTDGDWLL